MGSAAADSKTSNIMSRAEMSRLIAKRLQRDAALLRQSWSSARPFRHFVVDDLLPLEVGRKSRSSDWCSR